MSPGIRLYVLALGLSAAAGWMSGLVLLPLVTWAAMEAGIWVVSRLLRPRRAAEARPTRAAAARRSASAAPAA